MNNQKSDGPPPVPPHIVTLPKELAEGKRVTVTQPVVGICGMQVCAVKDATDEEILHLANCENPSGVSGAWSAVVRDPAKHKMSPDSGPIQCEADPNRIHYLLLC